jgi:hypothetical protein
VVLILIISGIIYLPYYPKYYGLDLNRLKYNIAAGLCIGGSPALVLIKIRIYLIKTGHKEFDFNMSGRSFLLC